MVPPGTLDGEDDDAMTTTADYEPEIATFQDLLLDMARQRDRCALLRMVTERLADRPSIALARIWLLDPGDVCAGSCDDHDDDDEEGERYLHLVASAGRSQVDGEDWSRTDGGSHRFRLGDRKVGEIAATGRPLLVPRIPDDATWIRDRAWLEREGIVGFGGQPLIHRRVGPDGEVADEVLGVIVVFTRVAAQCAGFKWLGIVADHVGAAIANARAFTEIQRLRERLELENQYLREEVEEAQSFGDIVGTSAALGAVLRQIELVAPTDASVLILGESGTGKELVAREIHRRSGRAEHPLIRVNCAAVPKDLYESEFFGHVKGAFTGAVRDRAGRFEAADGGTLFLDEVGEIPLELQGKLLRVLQEGSFERVGDERTRAVDVRIIAATNRDLKIEMEAGRFRSDLFYRLNVFPIEVVPLRARSDDIPLLADHFLRLAVAKLKREPPLLTEARIRELQSYDWPGNVRELQNVIERAVIVSPPGRPLRVDLPGVTPGIPAPAGRPVGVAAGRPAERDVLTDEEIRRIERENTVAALEQTDWRVYGDDGAASLLGIKPTTLASRIKKLGLRRPG